MDTATKDALSRIRIVVTDVDGIFTPDTMTFFVEPEEKTAPFGLETAGTVIRLAPVDADGNRIEYFAANESRIEGYSFYTPDGIAVRECVRYDIPFVMISGRRSPAVELRAKDLGALPMLGIKDKLKYIEIMLKERGLAWDDLLFMGNDIPDLSVIRAAGFSAGPSDSTPEVKAELDYVAKNPGGRGAVREVVQMMFEAKRLWHEIVTRESSLG